MRITGVVLLLVVLGFGCESNQTTAPAQVSASSTTTPTPNSAGTAATMPAAAEAVTALPSAATISTEAMATQPTHISTTSNATVALPRDSEFVLYTHCGVNGAMIDGRWWTATPPSSTS